MKWKEFMKEIKILIPAIFLALKDKDTKILAKIFGAMTIGYALSPIDLIPDFIPILGYLDDLIIIPLLVKLTLCFISNDKMEEYKRISKETFEQGLHKKWVYSIPILFIWGIILYYSFKFLEPLV